MRTTLFINYRRVEAEAAAGRLYDQLESSFGRGNLFIDVDNIPPGRDFAEELFAKVGECDVFLAVIGKSWLDAKDSMGNRRLDDPKDWVRIEIEAALQQKKLVIPVLVDGAVMPPVEKLPTTLAPLARKNAWRLTHARFRRDVQELAEAITKQQERAESEALKFVNQELANLKANESGLNTHISKSSKNISIVTGLFIATSLFILWLVNSHQFDKLKNGFGSVVVDQNQTPPPVAATTPKTRRVFDANTSVTTASIKQTC